MYSSDDIEYSVYLFHMTRRSEVISIRTSGCFWWTLCCSVSQIMDWASRCEADREPSEGVWVRSRVIDFGTEAVYILNRRKTRWAPCGSTVSDYWAFSHASWAGKKTLCEIRGGYSCFILVTVCSPLCSWAGRTNAIDVCPLQILKLDSRWLM